MRKGPYYFDYSLLPEKDPKFESEKRRVRMSSQGEEEPVRRGSISNKLSPQTSFNGNSSSSRKSSGSGSKYSFFDYSMIPDKMSK